MLNKPRFGLEMNHLKLNLDSKIREKERDTLTQMQNVLNPLKQKE